MTFRIIDEYKDFLTLEKVWNPLLEKSGSNHIHLTFEWINLWLKHFGKGNSLFIILCEDEGEIIGIAPFVIHKLGKFYRNTLKFRQLSLLGNAFQDYSDLIIADKRKEVLEGFFHIVFENEDKWDEINLRQINTASPNFEFFKNFEAADNIESDFNELIGCPFLKMEGSFEDYYKSIGGSWRKKNERNIRKLNAEGELKFEALQEMTDDVFSKIMKMVIKRKQEADRRSILLEEPKISFIKEMLPLFAEKKWIRVFTLSHNDELLTYSLSFDYNDVIYRWNTSYNLDYHNYSVGRILTKYIIEFCFENDYKMSDWMAGMEDHKSHWTNEQTVNYNFYLRKKNIKSFIAKTYSETKKGILNKTNVW